MKTIQLNNSTLELPDCWEDLSFEQRVFTFSILAQLFAGTVTPEVARLKMLVEYTGYRPSWIQLIREALTKNTEQRETINFNLLRLSEELTFAFTTDSPPLEGQGLEESGMIIKPNNLFHRNPISYVVIDRRRYTGRRFEVDINCRTNISAREFSDCFDLLLAMQQTDSDVERSGAIDQLCAILFPATDDYNANVISGHHYRMRRLYYPVKFGIVFWFSGIVRYYTEHPVYSILFSGKKQEADDGKLHLGMNEITLTLKKEGYGDPATMNLNDYFDAQIRYLRETIHRALSSGAKEAEISSKTGISLDAINKLT